MRFDSDWIYYKNEIVKKKIQINKKNNLKISVFLYLYKTIFLFFVKNIFKSIIDIYMYIYIFRKSSSALFFYLLK